MSNYDGRWEVVQIEEKEGSNSGCLPRSDLILLTEHFHLHPLLPW